MEEEKEKVKEEKQEKDYRILIDNGIKFLEESLVNLKKFIENSNFGKANKIEVESILKEVLQKTLDVLEQIRVKTEAIYVLEKLATKSSVEELEARINNLEKKLSNLGFATKMDLKELENRIIEKLTKK